MNLFIQSHNLVTNGENVMKLIISSGYKTFFILNSAKHGIYPAHKLLAFLNFVSMIKTIFEKLKAKNFCICQYISFYEQLKFPAQLS